VYINPPLTAVCVFNACDDDNTQKSNYYIMTIFCLGASLSSCKISLSLFKRGGQQQQKNTDEKEKNTNLVAVFFFASKNLFLLLFFGCFRVRRIIWCVNSRLFSLLNRLVQRDTGREEDKEEEGGRGRLCVLW